MKKTFLILICSLFLVAISCQKTVDFIEITHKLSSQPDQFANEQKWFEKKYSGIKLRSNDKKIPVWGKSFYHNFEFGRALVVPISYENNYSVSFVINKQNPKQLPKATLTTNELNYLLIRNDSESQYKDELVNVIPEENYLIRLKSRKNVVPFDGIINISDWNGNIKKGYIIENDKIKGSTVDSKKSKVLLLDCYETSYYLCPPENLASTGEIINYEGCGYLYSSTSCFVIGSSGNDGGGGNSYSDILGYYAFETPVEKTRKLAAKITNAYKQLGYCVPFSNALKKSMQANNIAGKVLQVRTIVTNQNIFSSLHPNAAIATNGFHQAIQVGDIVFDNMNPNGVDYNTWSNALDAINGINITSENF